MKPARAPEPATDADRLHRGRLEVQLALSEALVAARGPDEVARAALDAARRLGAPLSALMLCEHAGDADAPHAHEPACHLDVLASDGATAEEAAALASRADVRQGLGAAPGTSPCGVVPLDPAGARVLGVFCLRARSGDLGCLLVAAEAREAGDEAFWDLLSAVANWTGLALERALLHRRLEKAFEDARDAQRRLVQAEKQSAIGRLAAGLAHEIGTPLNVISGRAELLFEEFGADNARAAQAVRAITTQIDRISGLVRQLLDFAREHGPVRERIALAPVVEAVADLVRPSLLKAGADLVVEIRPDLPTVFANAHQLQQVFLNLLMNSQDAIVLDPDRTKKGRGRIVVVADSLDRRTVRVRVADTGHGIQPAHLDKVFDPFFSTKPVGTGTGLGLAVVYGIVTEHGGTVDIRSTWTEGTTVTLTLPTVAD